MQAAELLERLLMQRGLSGEAREKFLRPVFDENHDPFLIHEMDKAVARIFSAIEKKEKIIIFSDYDADGIPGAVILHDFFKKIGYANFENYIPHRVLEGFGLNDAAIDGFAKDNAKLIITIDCGTANIAEAKNIKKLGMDLIIIDHHLPTLIDMKEILPTAVAVLNHKRAASAYPESILCASGLCYKLVQAFLQKHGAQFGVKAGWEKWLLDMVAVATVSDMVPMIGENRIFTKYGLTVLQKSPRPGLQKLLSIIKVNQKTITEDDVSFMISPRVNAASRMGVPTDAFRMLVETDAAQAGAYAEHLNKINDERKVVVAQIVKEIKKQWKQIDPEKKRKVLVTGNPDWRPSLLGLIASSLMDEHDGPVFLWGRGEGETLKGSCRADAASDVVALMRECAEHFTEYGGHAKSGGFAVKPDHVDTLRDALEAAYVKLAKPQSEKELAADAVLSIDDITGELTDAVSMLAPFGMDNPKPVFLFQRATPSDVKMFGKKKDHLKLEFKQSNGRMVSAIAFFSSPEKFSAHIEAGMPLSLYANLEKSFFLGRPEIRLRIVDIQ